MSLSLSVCAFSSRAGSEKMNFSSSAASTKHQHGKGSANCSAWWKWILQHPLHTMEMPLSMHLLEGERKSHKKTSTEGYSNKAFSHSQMSLHCHAAQLILTYPATGFLWIFKGAEMLQSWGKKNPKKTNNKQKLTKKTPQSAFTDKNHLPRISSWVKHFIIFYAIYTTHKLSLYI